MAAEYATAKEWYKANRHELKKYRGQWIAYTNEGVISGDRDYRKMKDGIPADTPTVFTLGKYIAILCVIINLL
ncbi:hypothetical protein IQ269_24625 [Tychonema sp. LEGE 07199]|uniref:DUF5678 domain-containing protein n=1 Tax=unclassified Tychonema TaxID=2642144 RepID=UPI00187E4B3D|nr:MULTISPECIES: DUF5678 domain-containing protein [unclassified Tychonema]MBE9123894.1 hypothetical protein [Tychonema sp. LEGE 07199]MBE9135178.1 hypothetical protein [Tychonema sp. LEGE 07196]